ncbi:aromatic-ring-hydroxylating dioxygenase subunit beta [Corynebacterium sp. A21]|uniref:aromatic-ring-hydroxylating dioxygenase subunit beta n=1 Tax=Corynebacterium sp. A21 TaxID=3457318 RepID=UPI003FD40D03
MTELHNFNDPRVLRAIELVWKEAALLDAKDYPAWEELFTEAGFYVIPIDPDTTDFASSLNMVYDDKRMRNLRVGRMMQGYAPSAVAAARTVRVVSRFTVEEVSDTQVVLRSAQILSAFKRNAFQTIGAELTHTIVLDEAGDKIAEKVARLINSEDAVNAAGFLI